VIVVVRHGRTASNASGLLVGRSDPELDATGRAQAQAVALAVGPVDRVVCSPLGRTRATAAAWGLPVEVDDRFIELDYGDWDGRPVAEVTTEEWARWRSDLSWVPPGGESIAQLGARVRAGLADVAQDDRASEGVTVVVTHVSPIKAALGWSLGVGDEVAWRSFVAPASITRIGVRAGRASLVGFNDVAHLANL